MRILADNVVLLGALFLGILGLWVSWGSLLLLEVEPVRLVCPLLVYGLVIYVLFLCGRGKKWAVFKFLAVADIIVALTGIYWTTIYAGVIRSLPEVLEKVNYRYDKKYTLPLVQVLDEEVQLQVLLWCSILFLLCMGYGILKGHVWMAALVCVLPVLASFYTQTFPKVYGLVFMCLSLGIAQAYGQFQRQGAEALKACLLNLLFCGAVLAAAYYGCLPYLDTWHDNVEEERKQYSRMVNENWLPVVKNLLQWDEWFQSSTVKGNLQRSGEASNDEEDVFCITVDSMPVQTVYLRGFAGSTYTGFSWEADNSKALKKYYKRKGWTLPKDYAQLYNTTFARLCEENGNQVLHMDIREMTGSNQYALYPYGANLPQDGSVRADGAVKRKKNAYTYDYCPMGSGADGMVSGSMVSGGKEMSSEEAHYREYVYDTYLAYPKEQLPRLTEYLESWEEITDTAWAVSATVYYLGWNARYNINAAMTPEEEEFVEYFLFEEKEGWCAQFASSAVLILRRLGVPARYVTGYCASPDTFQRQEDGTYQAVVKGMQAHAWAEIYLDGWGWVPLEATPGAAAMTEDNRLEMLHYVGEMMDAGNQTVGQEDWMRTQMPDASRVMEKIGISGEDGQEEKEEMSSAPERQPDEAEKYNIGETDGGRRMPDGAGQDFGTESGMLQNGTHIIGGSNIKKEETESDMEKGAGWIWLPIGVALAAGVVVLAGFIRCKSVRLMDDWYESHKSTNEQTTRLYRRLQKMLSHVYGKKEGPPEELGQDGNMKMQRFLKIVERGTFAEGELSGEECREARCIYDDICKQIFDRKGKLWRLVFGCVWGVL